MKHRILITLTAASLAMTTAAPAAPKAGEPLVDFNREVRPILSDKCFTCHGPDEAQRQANLRLDTRRGAFAKRDGYQIIVPGSPEKSKLWERVSHEVEVARMPPPNAERHLRSDEIETLRTWIEQGAPWDEHWSYVKPERPALPEVSQPDWIRNAIDHFVLARLDAEGLKPSPETGKAKLLRRVTFDLTGLPPTPEQLDAFLADDSPNAYETVVDRLLGSPHYGERMAMQWLDLARYADTHGYHIDSLREMHHWRDYVINAFNDNKPFDEFTVEQLAGDLLPDATLEQKIASGFNRNHMINYEGGAIPEEYRNEYVIDRLETTATVWMAATVGCSRCHDHKYDPFKQREFYQFYDFFNNVSEVGLDGQRGNARPMLPLPSSEQKDRQSTLEEQIKAIKEQIPDEEIDKLAAEWLNTALDTTPPPKNDGLIAHYELHDHLFDTSGHHRHGRVVRGEPEYGQKYVGRGVFVNPETLIEFPGIPLSAGKPFTFAFWSRNSSDLYETQALAKIADAETRRGFEVNYGLLEPIPPLRGAHDIVVRLSHHYPDNAIEIRTKEAAESIRGGAHIAISYDGSSKASGFQLFVDGKPVDTEVVHDSLTGPVETSRELELGSHRVFRPNKGDFDDLRIYDRVFTAEEADQLANHEPTRAKISFPLKGCEAALARHREKTSDPDFDATNAQFDNSKEARKERACLARQTEFRKYYLTHAASDEQKRLFAEQTDLEKALAELKKEIPNVMVMDEREKPRETFILRRGDYRNKTDKVTAGTWAVLPPLPDDVPRNRLGLARWLVSPGHPLTARVTVNRYWQNYFGEGLVATSEDFGTQGERPSHPKLLDWLATEFVSSGWDIKRIQKLIVMSAAYRQSSKVSPELIARDPANRLLARGPRFRLDAEMIRDNALAIAGLLNPKVGGPSVSPYQPKGLWREMSFGSVFTGQVYKPSHGDDLYRRSMYTVWKRTVPPPSLLTFDAPDREKSITRRERTNTPLQALVMMNDPTYVEAARAFAQKIILEGGKSPADRLAYAYRRALARPPSPKEVEVLEGILDAQRAEFKADKSSAQELLTIGEFESGEKIKPIELAAWTTVASTILNLDEVVTKE